MYPWRNRLKPQGFAEDRSFSVRRARGLAAGRVVSGAARGRAERVGRLAACVAIGLIFCLTLSLSVVSARAQSAAPQSPTGAAETPSDQSGQSAPSAQPGQVQDMGEGPINVVTRPADRTVLPLDYSLQLPDSGGRPDVELGPSAGNATPSGASPAASVAKTSPTSAAKPAAKSSAEPPAAKPVAKPAPAGPAPSSSAVRVGPLRVSVSGGVLTLRLESLVPTSGVSWVNLYAPKRLAIDLPGEWTLAGPNVVRPGAGPFKFVVVGEHAGKMRLVVHFVDENARGEATPVVRPDATGVTLTVKSGR